MSRQRGQASIEWVAVLLLVGALVLGGAIVAVPVVAHQIAVMLGADRGPSDPVGAYDVGERGAARVWQGLLDASVVEQATVDALEAKGKAHHDVAWALYSRLPIDPDEPYAAVVGIDGIGRLPDLYKTRLKAGALAIRARTYDLSDAITREANAALIEGYGPELTALMQLIEAYPERKAIYDPRRQHLIALINDVVDLRDGGSSHRRAMWVFRPRDRGHVVPEAAAAEAAYDQARARFLARIDAYAPIERDLVERLTPVAWSRERAQLARLEELDGAERARFLRSLVPRLGTIEQQRVVSREIAADPRIAVRLDAERAVALTDTEGRLLGQTGLGLVRSVAHAYRLGTDPTVARKDADASLGEPIAKTITTFGPRWMALPVKATLALGAPDLLAGLGQLSNTVATADRVLRPLDRSVPQPVPTLASLGLPPYASLDDPPLP